MEGGPFNEDDSTTSSAASRPDAAGISRTSAAFLREVRRRLFNRRTNGDDDYDDDEVDVDVDVSGNAPP